MKKFAAFFVLTAIVILAASAAFAAPSKITFANPSSAGQTNYAATCSIVGILDNSNLLADNNERINTASLRTYALSKGGQANYSTALNTKGSQFRIACIKADGTEQVVKMFFDNISAYWMPVFKGIFKFY